MVTTVRTAVVEPAPDAEAEMALQLDICSDAEGFRDLRDAWQQLERSDPDTTPFNTWLWLSIWWQHYGDDAELLILVARRAQQVVAIAPFYIRQEKELGVLPLRVLRFVGFGGDTSPDYLNVLALPAYKAAACECFLQGIFNNARWDKLYLSDIPLDSTLDKSLRRALHQRSGHTLPCRQHTVLRRLLPDTWQQYRMELSRKRRKQINHRLNRLQSAGSHTVHICENPDEVEQATDALISLHRRRWISKGEAGGFESDTYVAFHRDYIRAGFAENRVWLVTLQSNDDMIGVLYIYYWNEELFFFQSGYSPEHEHLSPGHVLFTYVIEQAIERGIRRIDLLKGDYQYKSAYAREQVHTVDQVYVKPGLLSVIAQFKQTAHRILRH